MSKYKVIIDKEPTGYYLSVCNERIRYDLDLEIARLINMDVKFYKNKVIFEFNAFRDCDEIYFKYKSDCKDAAEWLESKLNKGEDHMNKQGLVLKGNEKKKLTFGDLEPGGLFIEEGCNTICRKISTETSTPGLSTSSKIYDGFYVIESGDLVGSVCRSYNNLTIRRVKLVNNECVYV